MLNNVRKINFPLHSQTEVLACLNTLCKKKCIYFLIIKVVKWYVGMLKFLFLIFKTSLPVHNFLKNKVLDYPIKTMVFTKIFIIGVITYLIL